MELVLMLAVTLDCILCHVVGPGYETSNVVVTFFGLGWTTRVAKRPDVAPREADWNGQNMNVIE